MNLESFNALLTPLGQTALRAAEALEPGELNFLRDHAQLSRRFPTELARAALEMAILRRSARSKFVQAEQMYFTREALEQATSQTIAEYRSRRFTGLDWVLDLGCSIGGDMFALAEQAPVIGIDLDSLRLRMARANLDTLGLSERVSLIQADLAIGVPVIGNRYAGVFFDPARRGDRGRVFSIHDYRPPLNHVRHWLDRFPAAGVKISPGVDLDQLREYPAEVEFISLEGELKEAVLWFGPLKSAWRRASLLPGGHTLAVEGLDQNTEFETAWLSEPLNFIYEPDPAVLRAGLVRQLGAELGAAQLDPEIAYLTSEQLVPTPFARAWPIESWLPFNLKRLRESLRQGRVNRVVVKKRGSPIDPQALIRDLRLRIEPGAEIIERVVFLTHLRGRPIIVICHPGV